MDSTPPLPTGDPILTQTKTKTRTRIAVATAVAVVGIGLFVAAGVARRASRTCDRGPHKTESCSNDQDCRTRVEREALCVRASRTLRTSPRTAGRGVPDIIVHSVTFDTDRLPTANILNRGTGTAVWRSPNTLQIQVQWLPDPGDDRFAPGSVIGGSTAGSPLADLTLARGASTVVSLTTPDHAVPENAAAARICADTGIPGVAESDETNNCWEGSLPPPLPAP